MNNQIQKTGDLKETRQSELRRTRNRTNRAWGIGRIQSWGVASPKEHPTVYRDVVHTDKLFPIVVIPMFG